MIMSKFGMRSQNLYFLKSILNKFLDMTNQSEGRNLRDMPERGERLPKIQVSATFGTGVLYPSQAVPWIHLRWTNKHQVM